MPTLNPDAVKHESEAIILAAGGQICDWLPILDADTKSRDLDAVVRRGLILNAMLQIYFKAPVHFIKDWIARNGLESSLSKSECGLLEKDDSDISEQELANLFWYIEALWALAWAGSLIEGLPFNKQVQNSLASLCPKLHLNEDRSRFAKSMRLRPDDELFRMLDLYYRVHWWTRNAQLIGGHTGEVSIDVVTERRKALEWIMDSSCDWDSVELST